MWREESEGRDVCACGGRRVRRRTCVHVEGGE